MSTIHVAKKASIPLQIIRILVGVLFIFSGLIKANDPMGLAYKMGEFFDLWNMHWANDYTLFLSISVITFEILAGVALLVGFRFRLFAGLLLLLMIFFTFLTGYAVWYEISTGNELKCGCFGDCIPLTANQSFGKDIFLLILSVILFVNRKKILPLFRNVTNALLILVALIATLALQWYTLKHLPIVDCLSYKKGNDIHKLMEVPEGAIPDKYESSFRINKEGKEQWFSQTEYMADSTLWELDVIEQKDRLVQKGNATPIIQDFHLIDPAGTDVTEDILHEKKYVYLLFIKDVEAANTSTLDQIRELRARTIADGIEFFIVTSSSLLLTQEFAKKHELNMPILQLDGTVSKTAMRTNPGLILLQEGVVKGKWSYKDFPTATP